MEEHIWAGKQQQASVPQKAQAAGAYQVAGAYGYSGGMSGIMTQPDASFRSRMRISRRS